MSNQETFQYHRAMIDVLEKIERNTRALLAESASEVPVEEIRRYWRGPIGSADLKKVSDWLDSQPEPASEPAKVECPNCGKMTSEPHWIDPMGGPRKWYCAQPEPVAAEMPDLQDALNDLWNAMGVPRLDVREISVSEAIIRKAIEAISTHAAQPAKVRMTEELERVLQQTVATAEHFLTMPGTVADVGQNLLRDVRAVRAQAAEAGTVRMPKVRALLESRPRNYPNLEYDAALAELDAAEGRK